MKTQTIKIFLLIAVLTVVFSMSTIAQDAPANLMDSCVENYDPELDYFPVKAEFTEAENITVEYFNSYKVITVLDAYDNAEPFSYVLVQCGTPAPQADDFPDGTQFIEIPAGAFIALSTTQLIHLKDLGLLDHLVGLDSFLYTSTPEVHEMIDAGELIEVGSGSTINVELVLDAEPSIVMSYGFNPDFDAHPVLIDAGVFTALNAEWREKTPLGRAEWIKYTAMFYNAEAAANEKFDEISADYHEALELAASVPEAERPSVLWNSFSTFDGAWQVPGAETYAGILIHDAGGVVALGEEAPEGSEFLSFETVYDGALDADVWVLNAFGVTSLADLQALDERYADFESFQSGGVWNNDLDVNENFGNNYYELGVTNPQLILRDLVALFHPDLLPDHEFVFFRLLE